MRRARAEQAGTPSTAQPSSADADWKGTLAAKASPATSSERRTSRADGSKPVFARPSRTSQRRPSCRYIWAPRLLRPPCDVPFQCGLCIFRKVHLQLLALQVTHTALPSLKPSFERTALPTAKSLSRQVCTCLLRHSQGATCSSLLFDGASTTQARSSLLHV